jgi:lysyl-tRNA synthetase, class II
MSRSVAAICFVLGLVNLLAVVAPGWHRSLARDLEAVPGVVENSAVLATAVAGITLWFLAGGLARGKRRAWLIAFVLLSLELFVRIYSCLTHSGRGWQSLVVAAVVWAYIGGCRPAFRARSMSITLRRAAVTVGSLTVGGVVVGVIISGLRSNVDTGVVGPALRLMYVFEGLIGLTTPLDMGNGRDDDLVYFSLLGIGVGIALVALHLALRAPRFIAFRRSEGEARMRELLESHGDDDSLGYFSLRSDKSTLWDQGRRACIAYTVISNVLLVSGDPLGPVDAWPGAMAAALRRAEREGLSIAVAGCGQRAASVWAEHTTLSAVPIGDEAIVTRATFSLEGRTMRNVRQMVNRAFRSGLSVHVSRVDELDTFARENFRQLARQWRSGPVERGHTMALGRVCDECDPEAVIAWAVHDERIVGFVQWVPWGQTGLSVDIMRRASDAPAGTTDAIVVATISGESMTHIRRFSLNFAPFRSLLDEAVQSDQRTWSRMKRAAARIAVSGTQAQSLRRFNAKYQPQWQPRFLLYPTALDLPRVATAYLRAESLLPSILNRPMRRHMATR